MSRVSDPMWQQVRPEDCHRSDKEVSQGPGCRYLLLGGRGAGMELERQWGNRSEKRFKKRKPVVVEKRGDWGGRRFKR